MKLFILKNNYHLEYDYFDELLIMANNVDDALTVQPELIPGLSAPHLTWPIDKSNISVREIGFAMGDGKPTILMTSYCAG